MRQPRTYPIEPRVGQDFRFTRRWFLTRNYGTFVKFVVPKWAGIPTIYLELGVFEGMSMVWMLQHVLTHPDSRSVGIDPWLITTKMDQAQMSDVMSNAFHNTAPWSGGKEDKCSLIQANSAEVLRRMVHKRGYAGIRRGSVDVCMVDGNHNSLAVWDDCRLVYKLLKVGGWMLLDDVENDIEKADHVKQGLQLFLNEVGGGVKEVWRHKYMVCLCKEK